jgi:hypothetical protein
MGLRGLRQVLPVCGAGLVMAVAGTMAFAASDAAPSSRAPGKGATSSTSHHGAGAAHRRHPARPAPHQATTHEEHKNEVATRPATASPAAPADKSLDQRPLLGPFSLGIETDPKIKPRSLAGGEVDFEREPGVRSKYDPTYLGLSIKSPFSW